MGEYDEISRLKEDERKFVDKQISNESALGISWSNMYACLHSCAADLDMTWLKFSEPINSALPLPTLQVLSPLSYTRAPWVISVHFIICL